MARPLRAPQTPLEPAPNGSEQFARHAGAFPAAAGETGTVDPLAPDPENRGGQGVWLGVGEYWPLLSLPEHSPGLAAGPQLAAPARAEALPAALLLERWVRKVALGGDARRGALRVEIGRGLLEGAELTIVGEAGSVTVDLALPAGAAFEDLGERIRARLARRGFSAEVTVR